MWNVSLSDMIIVGMALGMIDLIVTKTLIFEKFRKWVDRKSKFFGDLIHCPICFGTWLSAGTTIISGASPITNSKADWVITWFFLDFIVCLSAGILYRLYKDKE